MKRFGVSERSKRSSKPQERRLYSAGPGVARVTAGPCTGLARALSKLGFCSRSKARELIRCGRARVNEVVRRDPEFRVSLKRDRIDVDQQQIRRAEKVYVMLNKPRGLVTTASDDQGRGTVFQCLEGTGLPFVSPVGRLDQASEGLLLFTNDTEWAARLSAPSSHVAKIYHVQVNRIADESLLAELRRGATSEGELLRASRASILRTGSKNSWIEIQLMEGKNRHIRRLLAAFGVNVLRLVRVAIGNLQLGNVQKGRFRHLTREEIQALR
jgi:23S rRNA pseudouridine2605 synthase